LEKLGLGPGINENNCMGEFQGKKEVKRNNKNSFIFGRGYSVIHINYSSWCAHNSSYFFLLERAIFIGPSANFLNIEHSPNGSNLFGPLLQNRNKCIPSTTYLFSLYT
jgi:hypothetical protein